MKPRIAILLYGAEQNSRNALAEEKYAELVNAFVRGGVDVNTLAYNDSLADQLITSLLSFDGLLVWINPIEQGNDRKRLDQLLTEISNTGVFVSTRPEIILKMGTKEVLYTTREIGWSGDVSMYTSFHEFEIKFPASLQSGGSRVLKQYRGNGGDGVFRIELNTANHAVVVTQATSPFLSKECTWKEFYSEFKFFFEKDGLLIDQAWNKNAVNGMVRCYLCGNTVAGFGYQEINALSENKVGQDRTYRSPGKRYYFTEQCGMFSDLKTIMENEWVPQLQRILDIPDRKLPVIWDADFFINHPNHPSPAGKYELCEINVSCVSPFPPSAIKYIVNAVERTLVAK